MIPALPAELSDAFRFLLFCMTASPICLGIRNEIIKRAEADQMVTEPESVPANGGRNVFTRRNLSLNHFIDLTDFGKIPHEEHIGYFEYYPEKMELYLRPEWRQLLDCSDDTPRGQLFRFHRCIRPSDRKLVRGTLRKLIGGISDYFDLEYQLVLPSGQAVNISQHGQALRDGGSLKIVGVLSDVTTLRRFEQNITGLCFNDRLTGLRNHTYAEKLMQKVDEDHCEHYAFIMVDLNGLQRIDDENGYSEGDRLLSVTADMLSSCCEMDDIIARWGEDEFIIFISQKSWNYIDDLTKKVLAHNRILKNAGFDTSVSVGNAYSAGIYVPAHTLLHTAEDHMNRNKLLEENSIRSAPLTSLGISLFARDNETEEHTLRLRETGKTLGCNIGLSQEKLDELELLGLLHDIGKIGIPDSILNKPGRLEDSEWSVMKTHAEIGYRITSSIPELSHISQAILSHHERYDGTGYPSGLKGGDIPLLSRIITIVDSFDVMTHSRPYKPAYSIEYAVGDLQKCAGKQFDPQLVSVFLKLLEDGTIKPD